LNHIYFHLDFFNLEIDIADPRRNEMSNERPDPLADLLAHARRIIRDVRCGTPPPPFDELADQAAAAILVAMAFWQVARELDLRATAAAIAGAIRGLAAAARDGLPADEVDAALAALEDLLTRAATRAGAAA
jgi:hypothetical protein